MNDFSKNELFSAYLDGEATAEERKEVERLLAVDPAARQAFEDLKSMSRSVQALPREPFGIDLREAVLKEVKHRSSSSNEEPVATPLAKSIFRRLVTRRSMARLAATAAVVVVILILDRQQTMQKEPPQIAKAVVPKAETASKRNADQPWTPPSMQAIPKQPMDGEAGAVVKEQEASFGTPAATPGNVSGRELAESAKINADTNVISEESETDITVVHCEVSPKAMESQVFTQLLLSNGIGEQNQSSPLRQLVEAKEKDVKIVADAFEERREAEPMVPKEEPEANAATFVYVDATLEQIDATLADMSARPEAFSNVTISPPQDANAQRLVRQFNRSQNVQQQMQGSASLAEQQTASQLQAAKKDAVMSAGAGQRGQPASQPQQILSYSAENRSNVVRQRSAELSQSQNPLRTGQSDQSSLRQRVLFVLQPAVSLETQPSQPADQPPLIRP